MNETCVETDIPARLDRMPWTAWHWYFVIALGITWLLDGLEVTLAGALAGVIKRPEALGLTDSEVGISATGYLVGAVIGALFFGYLTDRLGRKKLFLLTLALYLVSTACTGLSWNLWSYVFFRTLTGAGIGGEYAAVNSAIDELIPARVRGHVDLAINATFWIGAIIGSAVTLLVLDTGLVSVEKGWRLIFMLGASIGLVILFIRRFIPESPRWLLVHGRAEEAEEIMREIEGSWVHPEPAALTTVRVCGGTHFREIYELLVKREPKRFVLGLVLMSTQAFFYNGIFFTYALVLTKFYGVPDTAVGWYIFPIALGNFFGPLLLGRLFDTVGRKPMIAITYALSGILLALSSWMFLQEQLTDTSQAISWSIIFFIASAAASSAYLTVSEIFPVEIRASAIAVFYAVGTFIGGVGAPLLFGALVETGQRLPLFWGYFGGAVLMVVAAVVELLWGVNAERRSLESISPWKPSEEAFRPGLP